MAISALYPEFLKQNKTKTELSTLLYSSKIIFILSKNWQHFWIKNLPQSWLPYTHYKLFINGCMCQFTTVLQLSIWELKAGGLAFTTSPGYRMHSTVLESSISKESGLYTSLIPVRGRRRQPDLCKASLVYTLRERGENDNC